MRIRKRDYELSLADLMETPAWEYALDEEQTPDQDERTVRPYDAPQPLDPEKAHFIVRASFHLADGTRMVGYIKPITRNAPRLIEPLVPVDLQPVIITGGGRVSFWYGASKPSLGRIQENFRRLDRTPADVFPIRFASDVEVSDSITEGIIEGFLYCSEDVCDFFRIKSTDIKIVR